MAPGFLHGKDKNGLLSPSTCNLQTVRLARKAIAEVHGSILKREKKKSGKIYTSTRMFLIFPQECVNIRSSNSIWKNLKIQVDF